MFASKYNQQYIFNQLNRQDDDGTLLRLKKFDTEEFQSLSNIYDSPTSLDDGDHSPMPTCINVRDVSFHYNSHLPVLNKVSLQVPQGKIYALLGASGCGKTTLLRMILGRLEPLSGSIRVFGIEPGSPELTIPGAGVGYMPQELALFQPLTIDEVFHYFGRLYNMSVDEINLKIQYFIDFLDLPSKNQQISQISGGEQRRVSLAVTMIHEPPLLILDEPTVGVDSLLRCRIWNYLENNCQKQGTTVLITTHYTEEARKAFRVGFVHSGVILAQDNPEQLIAKYRFASLEDVFYKLCVTKSSNMIKHETILKKIEKNKEEKKEDAFEERKENNEEKNRVTSTGDNDQLSSSGLGEDTQIMRHATENAPQSQNINNLTVSKVIETSMVSSQTTFTAISCGSTWSNRISALLRKNYILYKRNPVSIILLNVLPILQITFVSLLFEHNPKGIPIAVVNHDNRNTSLSNLLLNNFDDTVRIIPYESVSSAIQSVRTVDTWMAISFPQNFSYHFRQRFTSKLENVSSKTIEGSKIALYPDNSHFIFAFFTSRTIIEAFEVFAQQVGVMLDMNPAVFGSPIQLMPPVHGTYRISYLQFIIPGMIICIVHSMTMLIGSFTIVRERNEGHLERGFIAGIRPVEIILSHVIFLLLPVLLQVLWVLGIGLFCFQLTLKGSIIDVLIFTILAAFQGLIFGIGISVISPTEYVSMVVVFVLEMPLILASGALYPLESFTMINKLMQWNPLTLLVTSLRNIITRGWTLANISVLLGFISSILYWIILALFLFGFFIVRPYSTLL